MVNHQLGKIYKLVDNTNGNVYIGSTCKPYLSSRLAQHKNDYKRYLIENYHYVTSFDILKNGEYDIVLLESCPCDDKMQLYARERHYIETLKCINKYHPTRTYQEYRNENKEEINIKQMEHYNANKDVFKEKYNQNKEAINTRRRELRKLKKEQQQTNI